MPFGKNLKFLRKKEGWTIDTLAEKLNVSRATAGNYETEKTEPSQETLLKLADLFKVRIDELLSTDLSKKNGLQSNDHVEEAQFETKRIHKSKLKDLNLPSKAIPVYKDMTAAGMTQLYDDQSGVDGSVIVPGYEDCDFAIYAAGHSMYPVIENGCLVLCRRINDKRLIMWGEIYFVRTRDHRVIKRIQKSDKRGMITLVSDNDEKRKGSERRYEPADVPVDEILDLYIVKGIIKKIQI